MSKGNILIIEDEKGIFELVDFNLIKEGYSTISAMSGTETLKVLQNKLPDLILLDLMLPDTDGLDLCRIIKGNPKTKHIPIIIVTAKNEEIDIVTGLTLGADDYITKPFSLKVLIARIKTALRKKKESPIEKNSVIKIQDIEINPDYHEVTVNNTPIDLTHMEFKILHLLASHPGRVFTRNQIIEEIRGDDHIIIDRTIDVMMVSIRKKLGNYDHNIETVWGVGYRFKDCL